MIPVPVIILLIIVYVSVGVVLYEFGDVRRQNKFILFTVFISWIFSLTIIVLLPIDISLTIYENCRHDESSNGKNGTEVTNCGKVFNVSENVLRVLWRVLYWGSQMLSWLILPFLQSFARSGEFLLRDKLKRAFISNILYYGTYLLVIIILFIYVCVNYSLNWMQIRTVISLASNTWGLFLLVLLLGSGLIQIPRNVYNKSLLKESLQHAYYDLARFEDNKIECVADCEQLLSDAIALPINNQYKWLILKELRECLSLRNGGNCKRSENCVEDQNKYSNDIDFYSHDKYEEYVRIHTDVRKKTHSLRRWLALYRMKLKECGRLEEILTTTNDQSTLYRFVFVRCRSLLLKLIALLLTIWSLIVLWNEGTFWINSPVLSLYALLGEKDRNYTFLSFIYGMALAHLCICSYSTILSVRIFDYFYFAPKHSTNENSLIFSGLWLCRLTSALCYNFIGMTHLHNVRHETTFARVMGKFNLIPFLSKGFNIYFPSCILIICSLVYFRVERRILYLFGFDVFSISSYADSDDLITQGKLIVKKERLNQKDPTILKDNQILRHHRSFNEEQRKRYSSSHRHDEMKEEVELGKKFQRHDVFKDI
ncbi:hypothetical protein SNEBB_009532 [Seison nebaliae]|nr:hypothetical protein SNEBB_009532 [Seison nebaliae]